MRKKETPYLIRTLKQVLLGNFNDDDITLLGTAIQLVLSFYDVDLPFDVRDLIYDIIFWESSPQHIVQTLIDLLAFIPLIGTAKYADEAIEVATNFSKYSDKLLDAAQALVKSSDEAADIIKNASKHSDEVTEIVQGLVKNSDNVADVGKAVFCYVCQILF